MPNIRLRLPMAHQTPVESKVTVHRAVTRRLPIGAEVQPAANGGGVHFRVWAPDRKRVAVVIDGHATPLTREVDEARHRLLQRPDRRRRRRHALQVQTGRQRLPVPRHGVALPAGGTARAVAGRGSHALHVDRRQLARLHARRPGDLRDAHRHLHAGRHVARRGRSTGSAARHRHHAAGDHADRGIPREIRLGLRRRRLVRADAALWRAGRCARVRGSGARARTRRDPRRRLQPHRPRRQLSGRVLEVVFQQTLQERMGRSAELRRAGRARHARAGAGERAVLDRGIPLRRLSARRDAADLRRVGRSHPGRARARHARGRGGPRHADLSAKTNRSTRA